MRANAGQSVQGSQLSNIHPYFPTGPLFGGELCWWDSGRRMKELIQANAGTNATHLRDLVSLANRSVVSHLFAEKISLSSSMERMRGLLGEWMAT